MDQHETLHDRLRVHDRYQLELKLEYGVLPAQKAHYQVDMYLSLPASLGVNNTSLPSERFFLDVKEYVRLKTPPFALGKILHDKESPLRHLQTLAQAKGTSYRKLKDTCNWVGVTVRSSIRDYCIKLDTTLADDGYSGATDKKVEAYIENVSAILEKYRGLHKQLDNIETYTMVDELMSVQAERGATELFTALLTHKKAAASRKKLSAFAEAEAAYRKRQEYLTILAPDSDNETFATRLSILKKSVASVLHLESNTKKEGQNIEHMLSAVAAGISMVIATLIAFYYQVKYGNFTMPFFISLVVGYMFKDRIKEVTRHFLVKKARRRLYDRRIVIRNPNNEYVGQMREKVSFLKNHIDPHIFEGVRPELLKGNREILKFSKMVYVDAGTAARYQDFKIQAISDITRIDIRQFLKKMTEPSRTRQVIYGNVLKEYSVKRVYSIPVVVVFTLNNSTALRHFTLILERDGINRLETEDQ